MVTRAAARPTLPSARRQAVSQSDQCDRTAKAVKTKRHFPTEDAARKLLYLAIQNAVPQWTRTRDRTKALLAFQIQFGNRLPD